MSKILQFKRYANTTLATTTGADGELIIDSNSRAITVHDGNTAGGVRIATESFVANSINGISNALVQYAANTANTDLTIALASFAEANIAANLAQASFNSSNTSAANTVYLTGVNLTQNTNINTATILAQAAYNQANTGGAGTDAYARNTANTASNNITILFGIETTQNNNINTVTVLSQAAFNTANLTSNNITVLQGEINSANANVNILFGIETTQNNNINNVTLLSQASFNTANLASNNITVLQGEINSANANVNILFGIEATQNNNINTVTVLAQAAFNQANTGSIDSFARTTANTASSNTVYLSGIENTQNNSINTVTLLAQSSFNTANLTSNNITVLQGEINSANANVNILFGIETTQNTNIQIANTTANNALANTVYLQSALNSANSNISVLQTLANTDYTTLTASAGVYGNSTFVPVITLSANGRVTSITNTSIQSIAIDTTARVNANAALVTANSASANTVYLQGGLNTANANSTLLFGYVTSANSNIALLQGAMSSSNANVNILFGIESTQNNSITASFNQANTGTVLAQAAFNQANTGGGGSSSDQFARDTANSASLLAQSSFNEANSAYSLASASIQNAFYQVNVGGSYGFTASGSDTLNFVAGTNMTITACNSTKSVTFASSGGGGGGSTFDATSVFASSGGNANYGTLTGGITIPSGYTSSAGFILFVSDFSGGSIFGVYDGTASHTFTQHSWSGGGGQAYQLTGYGSGSDSIAISSSGNFDMIGYGPGFVVTSTDLSSPGSYTTNYSWSSGSIAPSNPGLNTTQNYAYGCLLLFSNYSSISAGLTAGTGVSMYLDSSHNAVWFKVPGTTWASGGAWATYPGNPGSTFYMTTMFFGQ